MNFDAPFDWNGLFATAWEGVYSGEFPAPAAPV
jgi:hypothetical protein